MASVKRDILFESKAIAASENGSGVSLELLSTAFIGYLDVSANDGSTTVDVDIEHSADGINWFTVISFTTVTNAVGREEVQITASLLPRVRASITLAGTPSATVAVSLYSDKRR